MLDNEGVQPTEAKIVPDGIHINRSDIKGIYISLLHDGELVAWITSDGEFVHIGEFRVVRAVERLMRKTLEESLRFPPPTVNLNKKK